MSLAQVIPKVLYSIVALVSLIMAVKSIFSAKFLPFHEQAAGRPLKDLESGLQNVVLALMKVSGLGFLVVALFLLLFLVLNYRSEESFSQLAVPLIALIYCFGLFLVNFQLSAKTGSKTPWKGSLYAALLILVAMIISIARL